MRRRGFLLGIASALAAPAIIRPGVLMPIRPVPIEHPAMAFLSTPGDAYAEFAAKLIAEISRGYGIPYKHLIAELKPVEYSAAREHMLLVADRRWPE